VLLHCIGKLSDKTDAFLFVRDRDSHRVVRIARDRVRDAMRAICFLLRV